MEYAFRLICCSLLSLCTIRNSVGIGRAVSSTCVRPGEKGWPQIPQLRRTRALGHVVSCPAGPELGRRAGCLRLLAPFDSQLVLGQGSELPLGFLTGHQWGSRSLCIPGLYPGPLACCPQMTPSPPSTGSARYAETPHRELCRCCSDLCQDHPSSSCLDHDLAAVKAGGADGCSPAILLGNPELQRMGLSSSPLSLGWPCVLVCRDSRG